MRQLLLGVREEEGVGVEVEALLLQLLLPLLGAGVEAEEGGLLLLLRGVLLQHQGEVAGAEVEEEGGVKPRTPTKVKVISHRIKF